MRKQGKIEPPKKEEKGWRRVKLVVQFGEKDKHGDPEIAEFYYDNEIDARREKEAHEREFREVKLTRVP